jgi:hypothetical protein
MDPHRFYAGIVVGFEIRKQLGHDVIFRVRRGNGQYGSVYKKRYQDQFAYVVPASINNEEGQASRDAFTTAMSNWKNVLTEEDKAEYNRRARKRKGIQGFNIYVGEYVKAHA